MLIWNVTQEEASLHSLQAFCVQALSVMVSMRPHQQPESCMERVKKTAPGVCWFAQQSAGQ